MERSAELIQMLERKPELKKYLFIRGFLLTNRLLDTDHFPFFSNWNIVKLGNFYAYTHNTLKLHYIKRTSKQGDCFFILFGHAYNPFSMEWREEKILERIAEAYETSLFMDRVNELTGVFLWCILKADQVEFLTDPSGLQSACWAFIDNCFYITSHPQLVGDICGLTLSDMTKELLAYKWYQRVKGPYLPGDMTPFDQVKRVVPNIYYIFSEGSVQHYRFYPITNIKVCKSEEEYRKVILTAASILKKNMQLVTKKWDNPQISLTGGIDSNTTFAAAKDFYDRIKTFSYLSAPKEKIDADAAKIIADHFSVPHKTYLVPSKENDLDNYKEFKAIIDHNNGYIAEGRPNEYRKRIYLIQTIEADVEVKSWVSESIRAYWYKHFGRKKLPPLSPKLYRNFYKIFIGNRKLAYKIDKLFDTYIKQYEYNKIPEIFTSSDMYYHEVGLGSWGSLNLSEMKLYAEITTIYNNRKFLDIMFRVPLQMRISDKHHIALKRVLNKELYDMNIRVVNMHETKMRAFLLNMIFMANMFLPF